MNVKLGGINTIPDPQSVTVLTDPRNPTIVMGNVYTFVIEAEFTPFANQAPMSFTLRLVRTADLRLRHSLETWTPTLQSMLRPVVYRIPV